MSENREVEISQPDNGSSILESMRFKYYGNYGGPGYSAKQFTDKPDWGVEPIDSLDEGFRRHDYDYGVMDHGRADRLLLRYLDSEWKPKSRTERLAGNAAYYGFLMKSGRYTEDDGKYVHPWEKGYSRTAAPSSSRKIDLLKKQIGHRTMSKNVKKKKIKKEVKKEVKKDVRKYLRLPRRPKRMGMYMSRKRRGGGRVGLGRRAPLIQKVMRPPVSSMSATNSGPAMYFFPAKPGCLGIGGTFRLGQCNTGTSGTFSVATTAGHAVSAAFPIMPQNSYYFPTSISTLANMFERYRMRHRLRFITMLPTSQAGKIGIAYTYDAAAVYDTYGIAGDTNTIPIAELTNSVTLREFPGYAEKWAGPWYGMKRNDDMKYVPGPVGPGTTVAWSSPSSSSLRDQIQGAYLFATTGFGNSLAIGDLFIDYQLELCNISIPPTNPTLLAEKEKKRVVERQWLEVESMLPEMVELLRTVKLEKEEFEEKTSVKKSSRKSEKGAIP